MSNPPVSKQYLGIAVAVAGGYLLAVGVQFLATLPDRHITEYRAAQQEYLNALNVHQLELQEREFLKGHGANIEILQSCEKKINEAITRVKNARERLRKY